MVAEGERVVQGSHFARIPRFDKKSPNVELCFCHNLTKSEDGGLGRREVASFHPVRGGSTFNTYNDLDDPLGDEPVLQQCPSLLRRLKKNIWMMRLLPTKARRPNQQKKY